jgi:Stage II sporulation protein M
LNNIVAALKRSMLATASFALIYVLAVVVGSVMVHSGNQFALNYRDRLVARAHAQDPVSLADRRGAHVRAALIDFSRNLGLGAIPSTVGGLVIVLSYPVAAYRGWVGGIVSVNNAHTSRLGTGREALNYVTTLALQLIPYCLAGGAGVTLGLAYYRARGRVPAPKRWLTLPADAVQDVLWIYAVITPLFLIASLWEFLNPWRV